ncbi:MAG: DUF460 domain-containing protein [Candidatus Thorarchaeota archaeon]|jgi:predicted RNase H-like nuclease (RuvC/YqgF family)
MSDDKEIIMGFDILPSHSARSKTAPKFACVIVREGIVLNEYPEISRGALLKMVRDISPKWLCTDNIFEIVPDSKSVFGLVDRIPVETRIVQVTGIPPRQVALKTLARRHKLEMKGKPSPLDSARLAAQLASLGVGHSLECFSEQTEIKITRGRKMGRGGQSANRYRRKIHSEIQQMTRHIESTLKLSEIDYDLDIRESDFGYSSARIVAYSPLPGVKGLVEAKRGGDFNVLISPVRKRVEFLPLEPKPVPTQIRPKFFILGIDPGTTAAICLLSLTGRIHLLKSRKGLTRADILRLVYEQGIPVLVGSDVPQVPHFVEKIASTINVETHTPQKPIPVSEKQELAREYSEEVRTRNSHERDALTAAVYAFRSIAPKLRQIDKKIRDEQLTIDRNHLKALVIKGMPINEAIASLVYEESEAVEVVPPKPAEEPVTQEQFDLLKKKHSELESDFETLIEKTEDLERYIEYLKFRESELVHSLDIINDENYWKVKRDRELAKKESEVRRTKREADSLRKQSKILDERLELLRGVKRLEIRGDMLAVKTIPQFTRESIDEYSRKIGLKSGDIVLFEDASGGGPQTAGLLIERGIRAVITDTTLSHLPAEELVKALIPVINAKKVQLQRIDEFAFISRKKFEQQLQKFMKRVKEQARQKGEDELVEIVERYRREIER